MCNITGRYFRVFFQFVFYAYGSIVSVSFIARSRLTYLHVVKNTEYKISFRRANGAHMKNSRLKFFILFYVIARITSRTSPQVLTALLKGCGRKGDGNYTDGRQSAGMARSNMKLSIV